MEPKTTIIKPNGVHANQSFIFIDDTIKGEFKIIDIKGNREKVIKGEQYIYMKLMYAICGIGLLIISQIMEGKEIEMP